MRGTPFLAPGFRRFMTVQWTSLECDSFEIRFIQKEYSTLKQEDRQSVDMFSFYFGSVPTMRHIIDAFSAKGLLDFKARGLSATGQHLHVLVLLVFPN